MVYKILIFQRTPTSNLVEYILQSGFLVDIATEENVCTKIEAKDYDACILDSADVNRYFYIQHVRLHNRNAAVIFLTNAVINNDAINAFDAGADDYIRMPYDIRELVYRLNAILKRSGKSSYGAKHAIGLYELDPKTKILSIGDEKTRLTEKETKLLMMLSEYRNTLLPRKIALKAIWIDDNVFNSRSMDVFIVKLRKLLSKDEKISIVNMRSQGYILNIE